MPHTAQPQPQLTFEEARLWARVGVLSAFALALSFVETLIPLPIPLPGAKLGLANAAVIVALAGLGPKYAAAVALIKVLAVGLLFGSPVMFPYSAVGTLLSLAAMFALSRIRGLNLVLISIVGSILHVVGQLFVASLFLGTVLVWSSFPVLFAIACVTGVIVGKIAHHLIEHLEEDPLPAPGEEPLDIQAAPFPVRTRRQDARCNQVTVAARRLDTRAILIALLAFMLTVFLAESPALLLICLAASLTAALATGARPRDMAKAAIPLFSILVITSVAQVLYVQQGTAIAQLGPITVTDAALSAIAIMFTRLLCFMMASLAFAQVVDGKQLIDALKGLISPLERRGIPAQPFILAFDLALETLPLLLDELKRLQAAEEQRAPAVEKKGVFPKLRSWLALLTPLCTSAFRHADQAAARLTASAR